MTKDEFIKRLYELVPHRGSASLNVLQDEMNKEQEEYEQQAIERALDSEYHLQRIIRVPSYDHNGDRRGDAERVAENVTLLYRDLTAWAKKAGVDAGTLQAVCEGRAKEVRTKEGDVWRGFPFVYVDRTPSQEDLDDREADMRDDENFRRKQSARQANKQAAVPGVVFTKFIGGTNS